MRQLRSAVSSWRRLDKLGKQKSLKELKLQLAQESDSASDGEPELEEIGGKTNATSQGAPSTSRIEVDSDPDLLEKQSLKIYENVHLFPNSSYLYYYPAIHWSLDKTPDSEDYWIGIYERGAPDDNIGGGRWL